MKRLYLLILPILLFLSCNLSFLDDAGDGDSEDGPSNYYHFDSSTDTKYYYDGSTEELIWYEVYDYNGSDQCIFRRRYLPNDAVLESSVYTWGGSNVIMESYFNVNNSLTWYNHIVYTSDKITQMTNYDSSGTAQYTRTSLYSGDNITETARFDGSGTLEWAYKYTYSSGTLYNRISQYDETGNSDGYVDFEYDGSDRVIKKTGYGEAGITNSFSATYGTYSFPVTGGVNTTSRNTDSLTAPSTPVPPSPTATLNDIGQSYAWMALWAYTSYGTAYTELNGNYFPTHLSFQSATSTPVHPVEIDLTYIGSSAIDTKTFSYNGEEVLILDFDYDGSGYPVSLDTSGTALFIPLRYEFTYGGTNDVPLRIEIYNSTTLLQRFDYSYVGGSPDAYDLTDFADNINRIDQYDGDLTHIGYYTFTYGAGTLTIAAFEADDTPNGRFEITFSTYGTNSYITEFTSYDSSNNQLWKREYDYENPDSLDADKYFKTVQTHLDGSDIPEVISSFDVETLFIELKNYLPLP